MIYLFVSEIFNFCNGQLGKAREVEKVLYELAGPKAIPGQYNDKKLRHDIQIFSLESIHVATNNFSSANKLGQGGYGPVYKVVKVKKLFGLS